MYKKKNTGMTRLWSALGYSADGFRAGWREEAAFRQECLVACVLIPLSFWLGQSWIEIMLLAGSVLMVLVVELLNSAIEATVDRIGPQPHELSKRAKDMGSAAVFLSLLFSAGIWVGAIYAYYR